MHIKENKKNEDLDFKHISNVIYLLEKLKHDKANIEFRKEIASNLEALNNNSDALFHLFISFELNPNDERIILSIIRNLLKINDIYEAKKWIIKLHNIENKLFSYNDKIYDKFENKKIICIGNEIKYLPFSIKINNLNSLSDLVSNQVKLNQIEIILHTNDDMNLFDSLIDNLSDQMYSLKYVFSINDEINNLFLKKKFKKYNNYNINNLIPSLNYMTFYTFIKHYE